MKRHIRLRQGMTVALACTMLATGSGTVSAAVPLGESSSIQSEQTVEEKENQHTAQDLVEDESKTPAENEEEAFETPAENGEEEPETPAEDGGEEAKTPAEDGREEAETPAEDGGEEAETPAEDGEEASKTPAEDGGEASEIPAEGGEEEPETPAGEEIQSSAPEMSEQTPPVGPQTGLILMENIQLVPQAVTVTPPSSGLRFDTAKSEYAEMSSTVTVPNTVELWVKLDQNKGKRQILFNDYQNGTEDSFGLEVTTSGTLRYWERDGEKKQETSLLFHDISICTNEWMLLSVVRDVEAQKVIVYVNGEYAAEQSGTLHTDLTLTHPLRFATDMRKTYWLNGEIGEVRFWSDVRTAEEIQAFASQQVTGEEEGLDHAWILDEVDGLGPDTVFEDLVGDVDVKAAGFQGEEEDDIQGLRFDMSENEYVQVQGAVEIPETVEALVKLDQNTNARQIIMNNYGNGGTSWGIEVNSDNTLRLWEQNTSGKDVNLYFRDVNICTGEWMMISLVRNQAENKADVYINGEYVTSQSVEGFGTGTLDHYLCFGGDYHTTPINLNGEIAEVRLWSDVRTAEEIKEYASKAVEGTEDGLAHAWSFRDCGTAYEDTVFPDLVADGFEVQAVGFAKDPNKEYTVRFELNGGTVEGEIQNQAGKIGETVTAPTKTPQKDGFTFLGWFQDPSCTVAWDFDSTTIKGDTVIYAGWEYEYEKTTFADDMTGITFSGPGDQLAMERRLSEVPLSFEATIKLPKDLDERGGVILGNYMDAGYYDYDLGYVNFEVYNHGAPRLYWRQERSNQPGGDEQSVVFQGVDLRQDEWIHVAITFDPEADTCSCYINGDLISTVQNCQFNPVVPAQALKVGGDYRGTGGTVDTKGYNSQYFKGEIANISVFSTVRTQEQIQSDVAALTQTAANIPAQQEGLLASWQFGVEQDLYEDNSDQDNDVACFVDWIDPDFAQGDYSIVALPDTQFLSAKYPEIYEKLTR